MVSENWPFLADALCRNQVEGKRDQILQEFWNLMSVAVRAGWAVAGAG